MRARGDWRALARYLSSRGWALDERRRHAFMVSPDGQTRVGVTGSADPRALANEWSKVRRFERGAVGRPPVKFSA